MMTCFDIGGSYIRYTPPGASGPVSEAGRISTPLNSWYEFVAALRGCLPENPGPAVISLAGAFDETTGLANVANIPCIDGRRICSDLSNELGIPVRIINDANAFALAEAMEGTGAGKDMVFAIVLGSGVGGGLSYKGELLKGNGGIAGEWGHGSVIDPTASDSFIGLPHLECGCGQIGCVDAYCSARGMEKIHKSLHGTDLTSLEITSTWHMGDAQAAQTIDVYTTLLSRALAMIVNLIGPDIIPASGGLSSDPLLLEQIDRKTRSLTLTSYDRSLIVRGKFADSSGLQGAAILARKEFPDAFS